MEDYIKKIYQIVFAQKQKAVVAFIVAAIGSYIVKHGISLDVTVGDALQSIVAGVVAHISVYFTRNKK